METETIEMVHGCDSVPGVTFSRSTDELPREHVYSVEDRPPWMFSIFNALQILVCQVFSVVWLPLTMSPALCLLPADPVRVYLVSTALLTSGVVTSLQSTLGIRLPTVAGPSALYSASFISLLRSPRLQCPSDGDLYAMGPALRGVEWQTRLRELQGGLLFVGFLQTLLGFSGVQSCLCRLLSPVAVAPAVILAGLSATQEPLNHLSDHWMYFFGVVLLMSLFALGLKNVSLPLPTFSLQKGLSSEMFPVFRMFPVLWTCATVFLCTNAASLLDLTAPVLSASLPITESESFQDAVDNSKWFFFPFPFEWGLPSLSVETAAHLVPAALLQSITSMVMFTASAHTCGLEPPPRSAVRRGLGVEGVGLLLGSLWGHPVSMSLDNIGLMSLSGIVSRSSSQLAALVMICLSHFTLFTSLLASIPVQLLSAVHLCLFASLVSIGTSILRHINFVTPRDSFIVGISLFLGLIGPQWVPVVDTGLPGLDRFLMQSLSSSVMMGAVSGVLLDLTLPGKTSKSDCWPVLSREDKKKYRLPTWEELLCSALEQSPFFVHQ